MRKGQDDGWFRQGERAQSATEMRGQYCRRTCNSNGGSVGSAVTGIAASVGEGVQDIAQEGVYFMLDGNLGMQRRREKRSMQEGTHASSMVCST